MTDYGLKLLDKAEFFTGNKEIFIKTWIDACERVKPLHYDIQVCAVSSPFLAKPHSISKWDPNSDVPMVVLHFPKFSMTDGTFVTNVHDMYIYILFENSTLFGCRASFTAQHLQAKFAHSHLNGNPARTGRAQHFCLGSGPLSGTLARAASHNNPNFNTDLLVYLIMEIAVYLKWQSMKL